MDPAHVTVLLAGSRHYIPHCTEPRTPSPCHVGGCICWDCREHRGLLPHAGVGQCGMTLCRVSEAADPGTGRAANTALPATAERRPCAHRQERREGKHSAGKGDSAQLGTGCHQPLGGHSVPCPALTHPCPTVPARGIAARRRGWMSIHLSPHTWQNVVPAGTQTLPWPGTMLSTPKLGLPSHGEGMSSTSGTAATHCYMAQWLGEASMGTSMGICNVTHEQPGTARPCTEPGASCRARSLCAALIPLFPGLGWEHTAESSGGGGCHPPDPGISPRCTNAALSTAGLALRFELQGSTAGALALGRGGDDGGPGLMQCQR